MVGPLEEDGRLLSASQMRAAFPTKLHPDMVEAADRFELHLSVRRIRTKYLAWCGALAVVLGGTGVLAVGTASSTRTILLVAGAFFLLLGAGLALGAKEHRLTVTREGIRLRKGREERFEPAAAVVEAVYGIVVDGSPREAGDRRPESLDQLEVVLRGRLPWRLILFQGGRYREPLAKAIGRLCGVPVRDVGEVPATRPYPPLSKLVPAPGQGAASQPPPVR